MYVSVYIYYFLVTIIVSRRGYFVELRKKEKDLLLRFITKHKKKKLPVILALYSHETGMKITTLEVYAEELQRAGLIK